MAYNPTSTGFSYHGGNRIMRSIDFYTKQFSADEKGSQKTKYLIHGIGMFSTWWYDNLIHVIASIIYLLLLKFNVKFILKNLACYSQSQFTLFDFVNTPIIT